MSNLTHKNILQSVLNIYLIGIILVIINPFTKLIAQEYKKVHISKYEQILREYFANTWNTLLSYQDQIKKLSSTNTTNIKGPYESTSEFRDRQRKANSEWKDEYNQKVNKIDENMRKNIPMAKFEVMIPIHPDNISYDADNEWLYLKTPAYPFKRYLTNNVITKYEIILPGEVDNRGKNEIHLLSADKDIYITLKHYPFLMGIRVNVSRNYARQHDILNNKFVLYLKFSVFPHTSSFGDFECSYGKELDEIRLNRNGEEFVFFNTRHNPFRWEVF